MAEQTCLAAQMLNLCIFEVLGQRMNLNPKLYA